MLVGDQSLLPHLPFTEPGSPHPRHHKEALRAVAFHPRYPLLSSGPDDGSVIACHGMVQVSVNAPASLCCKAPWGRFWPGPESLPPPQPTCCRTPLLVPVEQFGWALLNCGGPGSSLAFFTHSSLVFSLGVDALPPLTPCFWGGVCVGANVALDSQYRNLLGNLESAF